MAASRRFLASELGKFFFFSDDTSDVIIECENREFKCHRVMLVANSNYFGDLFEERSDPKVVLPEINARTFEAILRFMYTGGDIVPINFSNICCLLRASEHFRIPDLLEKCICFVKGNRLCVRSTFDLFRFACITRKQPLIDVLSEDILRQFRIFCRSDEFLKLSFDELKVILYRWKTTKAMSEAQLIFYSVYRRWINHDFESRRGYIENIEGIPQFKYFILELEMRRNMIVEPSLNLDFFVDDRINECVKPVGHDDVKEMRRGVANVRSRKNLNVFVQCSGENTARVFAVPNIWIGRHVSEEISNIRVSNQNLRSVALDDDHLFCMHFPRRQSSATSTLNLDQSFCLYDSVYLRQPIELQNPPVIFEDLALCSFDNRIYAFNKSQRIQMTSDLSSHVVFSDKAIKRGMFRYECDLGHWFPLPPMEKEFHVCCATFMRGVLLVCGSEHPYQPNTPKSHIEVRAYDHRSMNWLNFANEPLWHYAETSCCVIDFQPNRLFLHTQPQGAFTFDVVAQRWESQTRRAVPLNRQVQYGRLISFYDRVVAVGSSTANAYDDDPSYLVTEDLWYREDWQGDIYQSPWNISYEMSRAAERASGQITGIVLDAVLFKS